MRCVAQNFFLDTFVLDGTKQKLINNFLPAIYIPNDEVTENEFAGSFENYNRTTKTKNTWNKLFKMVYYFSAS